MYGKPPVFPICVSHILGTVQAISTESEFVPWLQDFVAGHTSVSESYNCLGATPREAGITQMEIIWD